jgi:serine/threonine protein kinase
MSPEQVRAEDLDGRSDMFSFAAVLYELLSGRRLFEPKSVLY